MSEASRQAVPDGLTLITGGARSGKSALAQRIGEAWPKQVFFYATATAGDDDMAKRIEKHRLSRPQSWSTIESPLEALSDLRETPEGALVIFDCLTMWVANHLLGGVKSEEIEQATAALVELFVSRESPTIVVTNDVGLGIVPDNELARRYRDTLGRVNQLVAESATMTLFASCGKVTRLENFEDVL